MHAYAKQVATVGIPIGEVNERTFDTDGDIELWPDAAVRVHLQEVSRGRFEVVEVGGDEDDPWFRFHNVELPFSKALDLARVLHANAEKTNA